MQRKFTPKISAGLVFFTTREAIENLMGHDELSKVLALDSVYLITIDNNVIKNVM